MISCIICSRQPDISAELRNNIDTTVGCVHEIVVIDNSHNQYSIFSAYNEGVKRAKGEILCFCHEDVMFVTPHWGQIITKHFEDKRIGILGFAGSHMLSRSPMYWVEMPFISEYNQINGELSDNWLFSGKNLVDIVACDGFCFFASKLIFNNIRFDDNMYRGFHMYDMDICLQTLQNGFRVCACHDVLVNHRYNGNTDADAFYKAQLIYFDKWKNVLPICRNLDDVPEYVLKKIDTLNKYAFDATKVRRSNRYKLGNLIIRLITCIAKYFKK